MTDHNPTEPVTAEALLRKLIATQSTHIVYWPTGHQPSLIAECDLTDSEIELLRSLGCPERD